ncbi:MAG: hypothetical protein QXR84_03050 [Candidatus Bathyarchaeia archaeon]|nr:hypothetical protein [Candidatus Bathyarchaeota archaeon]
MEKEKSESGILDTICEDIKRHGKISDENFDRLTAIFGSRFIKAWRIVHDNRVKKYIFKPSGRVVWIVVGRERDYLVMPDAGFCSCDDFYFHVMSRKAYLCYHLIGQRIAEVLGKYDVIEESDELFDFLMKEWKTVMS